MTQLGIRVEEYHTYEIYDPAIELSKKHFPFAIHHGNVENADFSQFKDFDLVMAGTCCQSLSRLRAEDNNVSSGLKGKSKIFWEFVRALNEIKPEYFLLENVIPKDINNADIMSEAVNAEPVLINSSSFGAQDRKRYYWTNIPIKTIPSESNIVLKDIMVDKVNEKEFYNKPFEFHSLDKRVVATLRINTHEMLKRVYNPEFKAPTLTCVNGGYQEKKVWDNGRVRKLTPIEYERLMNLPDNFTEGYSDNIRRSLCGNGWDLKVIKHILFGLKIEI